MNLKQMLSIKVLDDSFSHLVNFSGGLHTSHYIEWYRGIKFRKFNFYTDKKLTEINNKTSKSINVAWLLEPRGIAPGIYDWIFSNFHKFDYILTYDKFLLEQIPHAIFIPGAGSWIKKESFQIYSKNSNVCTIASGKKGIEGYSLRHQVIKQLREKIDYVCGRGYLPFEHKEDVLKDFRYSIVIHNTKQDYYFSDQLIDCLLTGTIPILWGNSSIYKFFNKDGIILFEEISQLEKILDNINEEDYLSRMPAIIDNFNRAYEFYCLEDYIYLNFIKNILTKEGVKNN